MLVEKALSSPTQQTKLIEAKSKTDKNGHLYYVFEYVSSGRGYTRHAFSTVTVSNGRFYTLATGCGEKRFKKLNKKLATIANSFQLQT